MKIVHFFDDLNQPYSCTDWGNAETMDIPSIIDDGSPGNIVFNWFEKSGWGCLHPLQSRDVGHSDS